MVSVRGLNIDNDSHEREQSMVAPSSTKYNSICLVFVWFFVKDIIMSSTIAS